MAYFKSLLVGIFIGLFIFSIFPLKGQKVSTGEEEFIIALTRNRTKAKVYAENTSSSNVIGYLNYNDSVKIVGFRGIRWKIIWNDGYGWTNAQMYAKGLKYYKESEQVKELQEKAEANRKRELADQEMRDRVSAEVAKYEREAEKQAEGERLRLLEEKHRLEELRKELLLQKYGPEIGTRLSNYELWIGMTRQMLIDSWGEPSDINRTVTANIVREQFVYGTGEYVYVNNGVVTALQD